MEEGQPLIEIDRYEKMMGTRVGVQLSVPHVGEMRARQAIDDCLAWMAEAAACLTRFSPASELSRLNRGAGEWQPVSEMLFAVMKAALDAARETGGLFDPALLPLLEAFGYDRDYTRIAHREAHTAWRVVPGVEVTGRWREIEMDEEGRRILLPKGVRLDLGGIAKGWIADEAFARFFQPFDNVLVDVGADMRLHGGPQPGVRWPIGMPNPGAARHGNTAGGDVVLALGAGGIATSGATERWWMRAGERQHHLIDPRTSHPITLWIDDADDGPDGVEAAHLPAVAAALAPTATEAEVAAKIALLHGYPRALGLVESAWAERERDPAGRYARVALIMMLGSGHVATSTNLTEYLAAWGEGGQIWL
jgi:thiamine biosynthesis lipoprotein